MMERVERMESKIGKRKVPTLGPTDPRVSELFVAGYCRHNADEPAQDRGQMQTALDKGMRLLATPEADVLGYFCDVVRVQPRATDRLRSCMWAQANCSCSRPTYSTTKRTTVAEPPHHTCAP
jgi:hypothetical protein